MNISSIAAEDIWPGSGHYNSAAKVDVNMLTKAFTNELGPKIHVNAIMPGLVPTKIAREALNLTDTDLPALEESLQLPAGDWVRQNTLALQYCFCVRLPHPRLPDSASACLEEAKQH